MPFFHLADARGLLQPLRVPSFTHRLSLYADDLFIFIKPTAHDLRLVQKILTAFAGASGLHTNTSECQFTPCTEEQIQLVQQLFRVSLFTFPAHTWESRSRSMLLRKRICSPWWTR
jgi:hypothetical protein